MNEKTEDDSTRGDEHESAGASWTPLVAIALIGLAGLLLEVGYTRVVSFKLWYYYTYLVIGLAMLGLGSGGVALALSGRLASRRPLANVRSAMVFAALSAVIGFLVISWLPINTVAIWEYGTGASLRALGALLAICLLVYAPFLGVGIAVASLISSGGSRISRLYFADLVGAGVGCVLAVPAIWFLGAPRAVIGAAAVFALVAVMLAWSPQSKVVAVTGRSAQRRSATQKHWRIASGAIAAVLVGLVVAAPLLPDVIPEKSKTPKWGDTASSGWGPVFRVDVVPVSRDDAIVMHDGTFGSGLHRFDGDVQTLGRYDTDPRRWAFDVLENDSPEVLIVGSAGGNEILASLHFGAETIQGVELNPVTVGLLRGDWADFTGHLLDRPEVDVDIGDGRSYIARTDRTFDLIWYVAPDSYAATNAASSGAFVLSESYLYTVEMIEEALARLKPGGVIVAQFGEVDIETKPNRTARYVATTVEALRRQKVADPAQHIMVATTGADFGSLSTIIVSRDPLTAPAENRMTSSVRQVPHSAVRYMPNVEPARPVQGSPASASQAATIIADLARSEDRAQTDQILATYPYDVGAITDDAPFFWHFRSFPDVFGDFGTAVKTIDPEDSIGERVLILLAMITVVLAAAALLLPFASVRSTWRALPGKAWSGLYFASLGLAFMLFEVSMIQRLVLFLGYPSFSLTVTLASLLVFAGLGSLWSGRLDRRFRARRPVLVLFVFLALVVIWAVYALFLDAIFDALLDSGVLVRIVVAFALLAPLGLCLGMFMPLGLAEVNRLSSPTDGPPEDSSGLAKTYTAWAWAVNGFSSVVGSVGTTMLAMTFGFSTVQVMALATYGLAALAFWRLAMKVRTVA